MTYDEAKAEREKLTASSLRRAAVIAEGKVAAILSELHEEPIYEQSGRLIQAAELLRAADTLAGRANVIELLRAKEHDDVATD